MKQENKDPKQSTDKTTPKPEAKVPVKRDPLLETKEIGKPHDRRSGREKVTGQARFSAENNPKGVVYAVLCGSPVAKGRLKGVDTRAAEAILGVLRVLTPFNGPHAGPAPTQEDAKSANASKNAGPLTETEIHHEGQYMACVVAETLEAAEEAARLVRFDVDAQRPTADFARAKVEDPEGKVGYTHDKDEVRGDPAKALANSPVRVSPTYTTPLENHNPIEPHATVAIWGKTEDGKDSLTVYDATQATYNLRDTLAKAFGVEPEHTRVISPFVGGAFGCKGTMWPHVPICVLAARAVGRPVKLAIQREQMFKEVGGRAATEQTVRIGADRQGDLKAMIQEGRTASAEYKEYLEPFTKPVHLMYDVANLRASQRVSKLNICVPTYMRAPGEVTGMYALESAMDELAWTLGMDPIALREANEPPMDPSKMERWSSRSLVPAMRSAAESFGWSRRNPKPRSMREGRLLVGMGMAPATYPENRSGAEATARITKDGLTVASSSHEIGTGTATAQAQIAADFAGLPFERVRMEYGDTKLPYAPVSGGSQTTACVGTAVHAAVRNLQAKMLELLAANPSSPLYGPETLKAAGALRFAAAMGSDAGGDPKEKVPSGTKAERRAIADVVTIGNGRIALKSDPAKSESYASALARLGIESLEAMGEFNPPPRGGGGQHPPQRSMHSFGATFVELTVDEDLGMVRVRRVVGAYGIGKAVNLKTCTSQMKGGVVMGIGMALSEHTVLDSRSGRIVNPNLADYLVPVNLDVPEIEVTFVPEDDMYVNPMGAKGVGELGIVGVAAAIANAVYHATGKRVRDLPITPDKLL